MNRAVGTGTPDMESHIVVISRYIRWGRGGGSVIFYVSAKDQAQTGTERVFAVPPFRSVPRGTERERNGGVLSARWNGTERNGGV